MIALIGLVARLLAILIVLTVYAVASTCRAVRQGITAWQVRREAQAWIPYDPEQPHIIHWRY